MQIDQNLTATSAFPCSRLGDHWQQLRRQFPTLGLPLDQSHDYRSARPLRNAATHKAAAEVIYRLPLRALRIYRESRA